MPRLSDQLTDPAIDARPGLLVATGTACLLACAITQSLWLAVLAVGFWVWAAVDRVLLNRRFRRIVNGKCVKCGYDLRATPARCPECGAAG